MVNARIRKTVRETHAKVGDIGPPTDFNYDYQHLGTCPQTLSEIAEGRHHFYSALSNAKNPVIIVGAGIFERNDKDAIFSVVETIAKKGNIIRPDWNGLNVLLLNAAQAASLDLGLVPESEHSIESAKFVYLMGADDVSLEKVPSDAFVVYQGHHGDQSVYRANVILLAAAFTEKEGTYVNTEGCAQQTLPANSGLPFAPNPLADDFINEIRPPTSGDLTTLAEDFTSEGRTARFQWICKRFTSWYGLGIGASASTEFKI